MAAPGTATFDGAAFDGAATDGVAALDAAGLAPTAEFDPEAAPAPVDPMAYGIPAITVAPVVGPDTRRQLFGLGIDAVVLDQAVDRCMRAVADGRPIEVGVVNAAKIVIMRSDRALHDAVSGTDLLVADGQSVVWASRFLGHPLPERVAGIDLFTTLLAAAEQEDRSVYLLGATAEVLTRTVAEVRRRHPQLRVAGSHDGYFTEADAPAVAAGIRASGADLLFLGMTSPKKELFCARHGAASGALVIHGVGGSFDVLAGVVRRAPRSWQRMGLEWLYRVLQEPVRLGPRYLRTNVRFVRLTLAERRRPTPAAAPVTVRTEEAA